MKTINSYWADCGNNFGDNLTWYIFDKLKDIRLVNGKPKDAYIISTGSILEHIPEDYTGIIFGSGMMFRETRKRFPQADIRALRGYLTAERMGVDNILLGDSGLLAHLLVKDRTKKYKLGIVPHYVDSDNPQVKQWITVPGVKVINIRSGVQKVIDEVAQCETIVSSAMHGLILADALDIPNEWVKLSNKVQGDDFKFYDYYSVFDISPNFKSKIDYVDESNYIRTNILEIKDKLHNEFEKICNNI